MAKHRFGSGRSFRSSFGPRHGQSSVGRQRRAIGQFERLEDRALLTTTVFIDFGEGLSRQLLTTVGELRRDLFGPNVVRAGFGDAEILQIVPLLQVFRSQQIDYNDDGRAGDLTDYLKFRDDVVSIVQRQFAPFDVNVEVAAAHTTADIKNAMLLNNGDFTGHNDAYVLAAGIYSGSTGGPRGQEDGWLGIASAVDLDQNLRNATDETVVVDGEYMLTSALQAGWNLATSFANVISHEAGHSFGLHHVSVGATLPAAQTTDQNLLAESELLTEGLGTDNDLLNVSFFSRYPLMLGDGNPDPTITRNSFEQLANDPDIGLRANAPQYVTGTGAFDRITITRIDSSTASVLVEPFRDNTFQASASITLGPPTGSFSYLLHGLNSHGIVVEAGRAQDQIIVDGLLGVPVLVRGGQGFDVLQVNGVPAADATYTPDSTYRVVPGNENYFGQIFQDNRREFFSYSGSVVAGRINELLTNIRYEEFDDGGAVHFNNFGSVAFQGSAGSDFLTLSNAGTGENQLDGVRGGVAFPNMRYSNVRSVLIDTGSAPATDAVTIGAINATGLGLLTVLTGAGDDYINITTPNLQFPTASGRMVLNFGSGRDTLNAYGDTDWTLADLQLTATAGGIVALQELLGENVNLVGGVGNNTFRVSGWNGVGRLIGGGGNDTVEITRDTSFSFGENFVNVFGVGGFLLNEMENLRLTGGMGANTFFDYGWNGSATLDGGIGATDMIAGIRDGNFRLTDTTYHAGGSLFSNTITLQNIELASLNGLGGFNQFDVSARTTPAAINGGGGQDVLIHSRNADVTLTNNSLTVSGPATNFFSLSGIEYAQLTGGASDNTFTIAQWAGSGVLVGGGGNDIFNIAAGSLDAVIGLWNIVGGAGSDRILLNDLMGPGGNYLIGPNSATMAPGTGRRFGSVFFDGTTEDLRLNANNAPNRIDVTPSLGTTFTIDGNSPGPPSGDALVLHTAFTGTPNGPFNGPGPGQRRFTFNAGHRDVIFEDIEQLLGAP